MAVNNSQRAAFGEELIKAMTGSFVNFDPLLHNPVIIIFDNQGSASIQLSVDGGATVWRTFPAGEALVLDLRANHGIASNYTFSIGTIFSAKGAGGSGNFSISYIYAQIRSDL